MHSGVLSGSQKDWFFMPSLELVWFLVLSAILSNVIETKQALGHRDPQQFPSAEGCRRGLCGIMKEHGGLGTWAFPDSVYSSIKWDS